MPITAFLPAFIALFGRRQNLRLAIDRLLAAGPVMPEVREMVDFIRASKRGVAFGPKGAAEPEGRTDD